MTAPEEAFRKKVRTGAWLFRYGYLDLETVTAKLERYAERTGVVREIGQEAVEQILSAAFAGIPLEPAQ